MTSSADTPQPQIPRAANPADTPLPQNNLAANESDAATQALTPQIRLRAIEPEDLDLLYAIENDPALWSVAASSAYYSRFMLKQYIAAASNDIYADSQLRLIAEIHFPPPTHKCAERFPRENTHPSPHECAERFPRENTQPSPHECAEQFPRENTHPSPHECAERFPRENTQPSPHECAERFSRENTHPSPHECAERFPREDTPPIPHKCAAPLPREIHQSPPEATPIAIADLTDFDPTHLRAQVGMVLLPAFRHKGLSVQVLRLLADHARRLHIHQLYATVAVTNTPAEAMMRSAGYTPTATLPDWLRTDKGFIDARIWQLRLD